MKDLQTKKILLQGLLKQHLHTFQLPKIGTSLALVGLTCNIDNSLITPSCFSIVSICNYHNFEIWHRRLGQASYDVVKQVLKRYNISCGNKTHLDFCTTCALGKAHNLSFSNFLIVLISPLKII